jgi:hypothetical protein
MKESISGKNAQPPTLQHLALRGKQKKVFSGQPHPQL